MTGISQSLSRPKGLQILVVEDEIVIARDIEGCLENLGYSVADIVASGTDAIHRATELHPDLVLMDIRLEGELDGIQAAEQIWGCLEIPIIYVTGFSDRNTLERAKITQPFGYILKPVEEQELFVAIETALHQYRVNRKLLDREQWLTSVLRDLGDGVIVIDTEKKVKFLNLVASGLTGWSQAEAVGKALPEIFALVHEDTGEPLQNPAIAALENGQLNYLAERTLLISKNGVMIPISDSGAPLRDETGAITGAVLMFRDVTQRRLAEERENAIQRASQLEAQMAELERLNQLKDDFLNTVSHELRTPLANMKMAIQILEVGLKQQGLLQTPNSESSRITRYFDILRNQCNQELTLVNDLLNLQHLNANTYELTPSLIELQTWIPYVLENFQGRAQENQQQLQVIVPPDLQPIISDEPSLVRILSELLNNACKYTPLGETITVAATLVRRERPNLSGETERVSVQRPTSNAQHTSVQLSVTNTGVELSTEEWSRIFDPFYRIPRSDIHNQGGTGLGLALVRKLVDHLEGSIQVSSGSGQTSFTVELPLEFPDTLVG
ncbi:response regulator [Kovacikia minuta CCNUW1]|uniref:hybrid sensor histidine kinase/response regulator n=1 Tax=Kovacikia minuta TaxID=2931930 RepID=UPI001CCFA21C|nr:ATP-binding protein [Kovacikia minuta]UBF27354.1 response regulator [Kovacikia minuta CCNUW1]